MVPLLLAALLPLAAADLPPEMKACSQSASDYSECLAKEIVNAVDFLKNGNRKFQIISLEPVSFNNLQINQGHGPVAIDLLFTDVNLHGLTGQKVYNVTNDWKKLKFKAQFKQVHMKGNYKIKGKVLVLPIEGTGPCDIEFDDVAADIVIDLKQVENNKMKVFEVTNFHVELNPKGMHFNFENLFNGDKALGDNMNLFLNTNWKEVMGELKPALSRGISDVFTKIANLVFKKIPVEQLQIP